MLLQLAGVVGESHDADLKEYIDIVSWSWGMLSPTDASSGQPFAKAKVDNFTIVKRADRSSPVLIQYLKQNTVIKTGKLLVRKAGGAGKLVYYEVEFKNLRVTSFATHSDKEELTETVMLAFENATFKYMPQSSTGAKGGGQVEYTVNAYDATK
jgi:type VI secretion system secreted protein Hcp